MPWQPGESGNPGGVRSDGKPKVKRVKLMSEAYKEVLSEYCDENTKEQLGLPDGATWAYAIAKQTTKRAVGAVGEEKIDFRAITELRETTEGKTPEKAIVAGGNAELAALAAIMKGEPAPPDDLESEDEVTENAEEDFHSSPE